VKEEMQELLVDALAMIADAVVAWKKHWGGTDNETSILGISFSTSGELHSMH
jgi:hypothetical protein